MIKIGAVLLIWEPVLKIPWADTGFGDGAKELESVEWKKSQKIELHKENSLIFLESRALR